ncbi:MAG TPA: cupin domain-containing protein [Ktedonobacteraceae bacterium]|nr:cupin domain-containing protein [Ktedonobacteraceae bacterium]
MQAFDIIDLISQQKQEDKLYLEFLRVPSLSVGVYTLSAGDEDPQQPHSEDEVYYIVSGQAHIQVGEEDQEVQAGSVIFVGAQVEHRFHSITEDLSVLVFFAPAEYSQQQNA